MTLRQHLLLMLAPALLLLAALGGVGIFLLDRVSRSIDYILRENYDSIAAMVGLNEALERIDSSFNFANLGEEDRARQAYRKQWREYRRQLEIERDNITILPQEQILFDRLEELTEKYHKAGDAFYALNPGDREARRNAYRGTGNREGLLQQFEAIKEVVGQIHQLNEDNMKKANASAQRRARDGLLVFSAGLVVAAALAGLLGWRTVRAILQPIQHVTQSARAIGLGDLDQVVPVLSRDELGDLADAFNRMARQLRDYRKTHLARLLRAQRTSQATIDSFPDPILVIDPAGHIEMANPAARQLLGLPPSPPPGEEVDPTSLPAWQPPAPLVVPLAEALSRQRPYLGKSFDQIVPFRVAGEERAYLPHILPIQGPYGGSLGAAVVLDDITRFRLLDQLKSDLVATVSHELKTPLTSVRLVLHLLLEETVGPLTAKQTELLIDGRDNAERLLSMIENLLVLARLEQARDSLDIGPHAPAELLRAVADTARPRAEDSHLELVVDAADDLPPIAVEPQRLTQALNNLLDNALAYTPPGGRITLAASVIDTAQVRLSVSDTGPGIAAEHLPHLFERFFRIPGHSAPGGTGLGLAIVREIVSAMHGQVSCQSKPGQGTTFQLTLPVWSGPEEGNGHAGPR
jgi:signal transduction histidine kinase